MTTIDANQYAANTLNSVLRGCSDTEIRLTNVLGQRYLGSGMKTGTSVRIDGVPGNAAGSFLDGGTLDIYGNVQDAVGDTMNDGRIIIHGSAGDTIGYSMRGGKIFVRGNAGYRAGIHMKAYQEKYPVLVIGGSVGSFLGEYLAGGVIIVLGLGMEKEKRAPVGYFTGTGMHGGKIYLRSEFLPRDLPAQVSAAKATAADLAYIREDLVEYCQAFGRDLETILDGSFYVLTPNSDNPYRQLYCAK